MKLSDLHEGSVPEKKITITLGVRGDAEQALARLLHGISTMCSIGASRTWGPVDGDTGEKIHNVGFDGDGADKLIDVRIDGKPVKDYVRK